MTMGNLKEIVEIGVTSVYQHYKKTAFLLLFLQKCVTSWKTSRVFQKHPTFARKRLLEDEISLNVTDNRAIKFKEQVNVT